MHDLGIRDGGIKYHKFHIDIHCPSFTSHHHNHCSRHIEMASSTNPRIRVRDATPADLDVLVDIHFDAFGTNVMGELLSPGGVTEDQKKKFGETILAPTTPVPGEGETIVKVAELLPENDNGGAAEVVAFGKWALFRHPRSEEEWNVEIPYQTLETLGEGANPEVYNDFIRALHVKRRDLAKGDPVLSEFYLDV